jgi:hypothetical protein
VNSDVGTPYHISALHVNGESSNVGGDQKCEEVWDEDHFTPTPSSGTGGRGYVNGDGGMPPYNSTDEESLLEELKKDIDSFVTSDEREEFELGAPQPHYSAEGEMPEGY